MVNFLYKIYIFVWILHGCLTNTVSALDPNYSVKKRLWCIYFSELFYNFSSASQLA